MFFIVRRVEEVSEGERWGRCLFTLTVIDKRNTV